MTGLEKLNFFLSTYGRLFVALFNFRLWPPFFIYFVVMILLILGIYGMFSPLLSGWLIPIVVWLTTADVLHFPQHLAYLPYAFQMANILPSLLLESLLSAAAVLMFVSYFKQNRASFAEALRTARANYLKIVMIWLVNVILIYLLFKFLPGLFRQFVHGSPRRETALMIGMQGLSSLLSALFIYAIPYLVIGKRTLAASFTGSFNLFFRNFFTTFFFVAVPQFITLILVIPMQNANTIVTKFNPLLMLWMTLGLAVLLALVSFFTTGSIIRFFLEVSEE
jgi:hypothetical protein